MEDPTSAPVLQLSASSSFLPSSLCVPRLQADNPQKLRRKKRKKQKQQMSYTQRCRALWRIREKWKLLGFFEINEDHEFYDFTCMLKKGLRASVQEAINNPQKMAVLNEASYAAVLKQIHEGFEMRTYAGPVFARFRHSLGIDETEYQSALSCDNSYLQFISNSKSSANFFLTNDKRFFLKTQSKRDINFLLSNLPKYIKYLENYPHSLLVKFLGVHSIIVPQEKKKYFIIMQSIFYPHERILERYDIKGCQAGRWTDAAPEDSQIILVFKDLNFEGKTISLDQQRAWFIQQVELDTQFLKGLDVMDYSILVGLQPLHKDEQAFNQTLANIIARTTISLSPESSQHNLYLRPSEMDDIDLASSSATQASSLEYLLRPGSGNTVQNLLAFYLMQRSSFDFRPLPSVSSNVMREVLGPEHLPDSSDSQMTAATDSSVPAVSFPSAIDIACPLPQNRRLLPSCRNPRHVLDGPEYRYFVGIIDLFTVYSFRKKLEYFWKSIRFRGQHFSTVSPSCYARRLCQWVEGHST